MKFNEWLLSQMADKDWSQADLARETNLTRATISNYVAGRTPDKNALRKLARAFKLAPELIFEKAGLLPPKPELSIIKRKLAHIAESLPDSDVEMAIALLEQRTEYYRKNPNAKPAK